MNLTSGETAILDAGHAAMVMHVGNTYNDGTSIVLDVETCVLFLIINMCPLCWRRKRRCERFALLA